MAYKYKINPYTGKLDRVIDETELSSGDMEKDTYDTDEDSIIDKAESLDDGEGNTATASDVKDAVDKKHTQNTDTILDEGGDNEVSAEEIKNAIASMGGSIPVTGILYVDSNRSDDYTEDGSITYPFKTISAANIEASSGKVILVLPGTYNSNITAKEGVTYYANTGHYSTSKVIMTGTFSIEKDDIMIVGFDFQSPTSHAIQVLNTNIDSLYILKNRIYNAGNDPILFNSTPSVAHTNIYINDNYIEKVDGSSDSGIWFYHVTGGEIKNNIIWTIGYNGIIADGIKDIVVSGNDIRSCGQSGIQIANSANANTVVEDNYFYGNNTSSSSDKGGMAIYPSADDIKVRYNIFDSNYNGFTVRDKSGEISSDVLVNYNKFINSTNYGVMNLAQGGGNLNAKWNWFGDSSGCDDDAGVINGTGDKITTNVIAEPFNNYGNRATDIRNDSSVSGDTVKEALETIDGDITTLESRAKVYTFNLPTTTIANAESIQIHRFTVPAGKQVKVWAAGLSSAAGTSVSGAKIRIYNESDSQEEYSTNSTIVTGEPIDTLTVAEKDISISVLNDSGLQGDFNGFISITIEAV